MTGKMAVDVYHSSLESPLLHSLTPRSALDLGAYLRMLVLGVGYLFPIVAVFAAFDYWKYLFPGRTVEYEVNGLYQLGSVITVLVLSFMRSINIRRRILTGFLGQFVCLGIILSFRWLQHRWLSEGALYTLLLVISVLMSVVTGILDSAILSLNSQYSPKMQEAMQIGIGCSIFVSVIYRDITKLMNESPESSATVFFALSLGTVLLCIYCFTTLLLLPISAHIPEVYHAEPDKVSLVSVLRRAWKNELVVFGHFALCAFGYPAMITAIPSYAHPSLQRHHWFQTILLTVFTVFDMMSRFMVSYRGSLTPRNIGWTLLLRFSTVPCLVLCATGYMASDTLSVIAVAVFGILNGYLISLSLVFMNELEGFTRDELFVLGRFSAFAVNSGLCVGGVAALYLAKALQLQ